MVNLLFSLSIFSVFNVLFFIEFRKQSITKISFHISSSTEDSGCGGSSSSDVDIEEIDVQSTSNSSTSSNSLKSCKFSISNLLKEEKPKPNLSPFTNPIYSQFLPLLNPLAFSLQNFQAHTQNHNGSPCFHQHLPQLPRTFPEVKREPCKTTEKSLSCEVCGKTFKHLRMLNRHRRNHSPYKKYKCEFCGKGFNDSFDLKRHVRTHTGVKPYKCSDCDKSFTQRCSLESHMDKIHGVKHKFNYKQRREKIYVCEDCGHSTHDVREHYKHSREHQAARSNTQPQSLPMMA